MPSHINDHTTEGQLAKSLADLHEKFDALHAKIASLISPPADLPKAEEPPKAPEEKKA